MAAIKKNIWFLFYIILFCGSVLFAILSYLKWGDILHEYEHENESITKLVANSTATYLAQTEMLLKILGDQLVQENRYTDAVVSKQIFKDLIKMDPSIAGFGLVRPDGSYKMFSGNDEQIKKLPNLLTQEKSRDSFKKALETDDMVLGRTYYFAPLDAMIIPARKAIKDADGKVMAVMAIAINLSKITFLNTHILFSDESVIQLYRDDDRRRQFFLSKSINVNDEHLYDKPVSQNDYKKLQQDIFKKYGAAVYDLKTSKRVITYNVPRPSFLTEGEYETYLTSTTFVTGQNLWVLSQIPGRIIKASFIKIFCVYIAIFVIVYSVLFMMFRHIARFEDAKRETLRHQATHDPLTQLPNRQYLLDYTDEWFASNAKGSVLFVDLDDFKYANDSFGHDIGDVVLGDVAKRLNKLIKNGDLVCRHGGDEFVILSGVTDKRALGAYATEIISSLSQPYQASELTILLGASVGVSRFPEDGDRLSDLISFADVALYEAKKEKNSYCLFEKAFRQDLLDKIELENLMKQALGQNEFYMNYQPQLNADGTLYGVEALVRWRNEKLGFVGPDVFIPLAEHNGFITLLGDYILDQVLNDIHQLQQKSGVMFQASINISLRQFMAADFFDKVMDKIKQVGIDPKYVTLEVTEGLYIQDINYVIALLNKFKERGLKISMDDFGTGYSSLSILNKLPIDELKIDKQFIDNILLDEPSLNMVESIVNIGKAFDFHLLAEGVETQEQVDLLKGMACETYQGYFYAKPLSLQDLTDFVK